jgi:hypothetical protein
MSVTVELLGTEYLAVPSGSADKFRVLWMCLKQHTVDLTQWNKLATFVENLVVAYFVGLSCWFLPLDSLSCQFKSWLHTCNITAHRNTVSWRCGRDSCPRNVSKVGYAVTLRAFFGVLSVFGRRIKGMIRLRPEKVWTCNVIMHGHHTCSGRNRVIPFMRRPNTDSTPKKPVTLPRNELFISYAGTSPFHTVTIRCYDTR